MTKIIITGGHHNSALVVARDLASLGHQVVWIGHRYASRGDRNDSAEYLEVTSSGFKFYDLAAGRFTFSAQELLRLPGGIVSARKILKQEKPDAVLTFGGYIGASVGMAASLLGIPIYLHEQTQTVGLSNKLIGTFAKRIYLTWPSSAKYFKNQSHLVVGLPLRPKILHGESTPVFTGKLPTILVMGGKQGSHVINDFIFKNLEELLSSYNLIHQTGTNSFTGDYEKALSLSENLDSAKGRYLPLGYISESLLGQYLRTSSLYFGRSGAHITYELSILGLKAILVPYLHTRDHEQHQNAKYLEQVGLGQVLPESQLSLKNFLHATKQLASRKPLPVGLNRDASSLLIKDMLKDLRRGE